MESIWPANAATPEANEQHYASISRAAWPRVYGSRLKSNLMLYKTAQATLWALENVWRATIGPSGQTKDTASSETETIEYAISDKERDARGRAFFLRAAKEMMEQQGEGMVYAFSADGLCFEMEKRSREMHGATLYEAYTVRHDLQYAISPKSIPRMVFAISKLICGGSLESRAQYVMIKPLDGAFGHVPTTVYFRRLKFDENTRGNASAFLMTNFVPEGGLETWRRRRVLWQEKGGIAK
jgi:hypothetical protein